MTTARRFVSLLLIVFLLLAGCHSGTAAKVSGKITYKGEPVPSGSITFHNAQGGVFQYALRGAAYSGSDMPVGEELAVTIETESANPDGKNKANYGQGEGKAGGDPNDYMNKMKQMGKIPTSPTNDGPYVKIPEKYSSKETSGLKVTLGRGTNVHDFDLTD
jgi:hypothetical protein